MAPGPTPLDCWVISDGRRGIENQALGLAEACHRVKALNITRQIIEAGAAFKAAPPKMQFAMRSDPIRYGLSKPYPEIAIGCGRQAIAPLMALKKESPRTFTVYIQDPRIEYDNFDLVIAPEHDDILAKNVACMIGAPNRITNGEIIAQVLAFNERLAGLPMPRATMLIGGPSKTHKLSKDNHAAHLKAAQDVLASGRTLLISASRRTPDWVAEDYRKLAQDHEEIWLYEGGDPNPYLAFLGGADTILVTEESTNMLTDACSTGKTVFRLPMSGDPGKFQILYDSLAERCHVTRFDGHFSGQTYLPLDETARMADTVWAWYATR